MSPFKDIGRQVLEVVLTSHLGNRADQYDVPGLVNAYVETFGFLDLDEVNDDRLRELTAKYRKLGLDNTPSSN